MMAFSKRILMAAAVLIAPPHAAIVMLYGIARLTGHVEHWLVDALSYVLPLLLMLSILHLPGAIWRRSGFLASVAAFPLVVFSVLYGPSYLPKLTAKEDGPSFTVMSYNVWYANEQYSDIVEAINETAPDIVGLQELTPRIAIEIQRDLADRYPFRAIDGDQAIFSRFPIVDREVLLIGHENAPIPVQHVRLDVNGRLIGIINAHPHSPQLMASRLLGLRLGYPSGLANRPRDLEVREMLKAIETMEGPLVVLGDFNLTDLQAVYEEMTQVLLDAHKEAGYGLGFTRTPLRGVGPATWRIDFVFYTPELTALTATNGDYAGSDHRPVVAELAFRD